VEIPPTLSVAVEGSALRQVLLNLILNARQAMDTGGTLAIVAANEGDEIRLEVTDTGKGIAPEDHRRIFEPFYSGREQGSGLGLAITRRVVEAAGGRIEVTSELSVGTTFTITLPGSGEGGAG
jgi:two-component system sensor histidine kinase HydH